MNNSYIIKNAYSYFDSIREKNESLLKSIYSWNEVSQGNDMNRPIIEFKDKNGNILFKVKYEILSIEYEINNETLWVWAWAHPKLEKNKTLLCRNLLKYGLDITNTTDYIDIFLKSILTNSRLNVNKLESDLLLALSLYMTKQKGILTIDYDKSNNSKLWILITDFID